MSELRKQLPSYVPRDLPLFLLPLLCLLVYLPALQHDFVMDDTMLVVANPYITSWKYFPQMLSQDAWNVWERHNYWRPIFSISLALDYSLWGLNSLGFHLTNILLHAANTTLLYLLVTRLRNAQAGTMASLLFAIHPIQTHAVSVISVRADLLAALFCLYADAGPSLQRNIGILAFPFHCRAFDRKGKAGFKTRFGRRYFRTLSPDPMVFGFFFLSSRKYFFLPRCSLRASASRLQGVNPLLSIPF